MSVKGKKDRTIERRVGTCIGAFRRTGHSRLPALPVAPEKIRDTSGAGDVFHGAYLASRLLHPDKPWAEHFHFARAAAAHKIQHVGNEAGLPTLGDIQQIMAAT